LCADTKGFGRRVPSRYERALDSVVDKLLQRSAVTDLLYVAELISGTKVGG
jgi:hypothetical protein